MRRAAAAAPVDHVIEERLGFFAALRAADGVDDTDVGDALESVARLRVLEPDLDDPVAALSGDDVCAALALEPGPDVGVALHWLAERRFAEGPLDAADARERLVEWWPAGAAD